MKRFCFVKCNQTVNNNLEIAMRIILTEQGLPYGEIVDIKGAMTLSHGRINPTSGFVLVAPDEKVLLNYFTLCDWIEVNGLRKI